MPCEASNYKTNRTHVQGGKIQIGAPTGRWLLIVVYRGKHDPVSRNYLVALGQVRCAFFQHHACWP